MKTQNFPEVKEKKGKLFMEMQRFNIIPWEAEQNKMTSGQ